MASNKKTALKYYHGLIIFAVFMAIFIIFGPAVQHSLLLWGVAITELFMLFYSVGTVLVLRQDLHDVFPLKKVKSAQIGGLLLFMAGASLTANTVNIIICRLFPAALTESYAVSSLESTLPFWLSAFIMAVLPAVCEEALHRGIIMYTMKSIGSKTELVAVMGIIFGIFHLSLYRFLPTAVLGAALTYLMLTTDNFLMPVIAHFLNNFIAVTAAAALETFAEKINTPTAVTQANVGAYLLLCAAAPFLLYRGAEMLKGQKRDRSVYIKPSAAVEKAPAGRRICLIIAAICACCGLLLIMLSR